MTKKDRMTGGKKLAVVFLVLAGAMLLAAGLVRLYAG